MKKFELNYEQDIEIIQTIKNIILSRYPIVENRMDILFGYPRPAIEINLLFYKDDEEITDVLFCTGTESIKHSIPERITINGLISTKAVCDLIYFILSDHDYFKNIYKSQTDIELSFGVDMREDNMSGISCGEIRLTLSFSNHPNRESLLRYYLTEIVNKFYEQLKDTDTFRNEYNEYCLLAKKKIINSLTQEDLQTLISLLNSEDLCKMLFNMPNSRFVELYNNFEEQKKQEKNLVKREITTTETLNN